VAFCYSCGEEVDKDVAIYDTSAAYLQVVTHETNQFDSQDVYIETNYWLYTVDAAGFEPP
jgi:hypothetical protein